MDAGKTIDASDLAEGICELADLMLDVAEFILDVL
jgi:hypothetical protein